MKRILAVLTALVLFGWGMSIVSSTPSESNLLPASTSTDSDSILADLSKEAGILIRRSDVMPQIAYAQQPICSIDCLAFHAWGAKGAWSVFRTRPVYAHDSRSLAWREHATGNIPPVSIFVSWEGYVENMEISPGGGSSGSGVTSGNIVFHKINVNGCDGVAGSSTQNIAIQGRPCIASVDYDIDWDQAINGTEQWDWIYFWVRDPDFVAMKGVDAGSNCNTSQWPYEYVNAGPKYSICQDFGSVYTRAHGVTGIDVTYDVLYEEGAPPTATTGATITPPAPITATPCAGLNC